MAEVSLRVDGPVATVTLEAPRRRNALTPGMARELAAQLADVDADGSVAAVVVRGAGGAFCAGAELTALDAISASPAAAGAYADVDALYLPFLMLARLRAVTIAAVRGPAVGAGLNLALAADIRVVAHDARLRSGFPQLGVHPGGGHLHLITRAAGREAAAAMAVLGQEVSGTRAAQLGLAWEAVDDADVERRCAELAGAVGSDPRLAREVVASLRLEADLGGGPLDLAARVERAPQMLSFQRRAAAGTRGSVHPSMVATATP